MTNTDVVLKLIGPVYPMGETTTDKQRLYNLVEMQEVVIKLISEIEHVAGASISNEHSVRVLGKQAREFLVGLGQRLKESTL